MLKKIVATAVVVFASACIDDGVHGTQGSLPTEESPDVTGLDTPNQTPSSMAPENLSPQPRQQDKDQLPECDLLPQDGSACAHGCDEDALRAFIPEGTCATFTCTLTDGSEFLIGGCN
jgi:hypothetical protein